MKQKETKANNWIRSYMQLLNRREKLDSELTVILFQNICRLNHKSYKKASESTIYPTVHPWAQAFLLRTSMGPGLSYQVLVTGFAHDRAVP